MKPNENLPHKQEFGIKPTHGFPIIKIQFFHVIGETIKKKQQNYVGLHKFTQ